MFNLAQVSTVAHVLHDVVLATLEHDEALVVQTDNVACAVDQFGISLVQGVLHEGSSSLLGVVVVTHRQRRASDTKFSLNTRLADGLVFIVEDEDVGIAAGIADRQRLLVRNLLINNIIGAVEGNLDGAVEVGECHLRQMMMPVVVLFGGKYLACEPYCTEALKLKTRQQVHVGDVHHNRRHPEQVVYLMLLEHLEDLRREGCEVGGQHDEGAGLRHEHAQFEAVDVEDDGRE